MRALLGANAALGLPPTLGGLGSWYDGATFALEARTPALMYGPSHIDWAHTVGEHVPIDDLVRCAQGIAVAGLTVDPAHEHGIAVNRAPQRLDDRHRRINARSRETVTHPSSMERIGIEPVTFGLQSRRSPS